MKKESKDKQLLRELSKGDIFAFNEIYKKYSKLIYSYSLKYLKSKEDADGVVQEIFLNLWRKRADLKLMGLWFNRRFKRTYI